MFDFSIISTSFTLPLLPLATSSSSFGHSMRIFLFSFRWSPSGCRRCFSHLINSSNFICVIVCAVTTHDSPTHTPYFLLHSRNEFVDLVIHIFFAWIVFLLFVFISVQHFVFGLLSLVDVSSVHGEEDARFMISMFLAFASIRIVVRRSIQIHSKSWMRRNGHAALHAMAMA